MNEFYFVFGIFVLVVLFATLIVRFIQLKRERPPLRIVEDEDDAIEDAIKRWDRLQTKRGRNIWWE